MRLVSDELHPCPVWRCPKLIETHRLMCFDHWRQVPPPLSLALIRIRDRQHGRTDSDEYHFALIRCVEAVNALPEDEDE